VWPSAHSHTRQVVMNATGCSHPISAYGKVCLVCWSPSAGIELGPIKLEAPDGTPKGARALVGCLMSALFTLGLPPALTAFVAALRSSTSETASPTVAPSRQGAAPQEPAVEPPPAKKAPPVDASLTLDLKMYCARRGFVGVTNRDNTGYGWVCVGTFGRSQGINMNHVCELQYGTKYGASLLSGSQGRADEWRCQLGSESEPAKSAQEPVPREETPPAAPETSPRAARTADDRDRYDRCQPGYALHLTYDGREFAHECLPRGWDSDRYHRGYRDSGPPRHERRERWQRR
jgi:hypothetical protein